MTKGSSVELIKDGGSLTLKIKFTNINHDEKFVHKKKTVNVGDVIDVSKERAESLISRGKAEAVKETPKPKNESNK